MFERSRTISFARGNLKTPLLVPSISSKGFESIQPDEGERRSEVDDYLDYSSTHLERSLLVSAFDLHYRHLTNTEAFSSGTFANSIFGTPQLLIVDSGGYEAKTAFDDYDVYRDVAANRTWSKEQHTAVVDSWGEDVRALVVSYDSDLLGAPAGASTTYAGQIASAQEWFSQRPHLSSDILLKPERGLFHEFKHLGPHLERLAAFDVVGVTEKEIGDSIVDRCRTLVDLRRKLDEAGVDKPIHLFGSLDPLLSPIYHMAGAEIFDGLTWLRYGYHEGACMYRQAPSLLGQRFSLPKRKWLASMILENLLYLDDLEAEMRNFAVTGEIESFRTTRTYMSDAYHHLKPILGGSNGG